MYYIIVDSLRSVSQLCVEPWRYYIVKYNTSMVELLALKIILETTVNREIFASVLFSRMIFTNALSNANLRRTKISTLMH
jgi:hypothetical protein